MDINHEVGEVDRTLCRSAHGNILRFNGGGGDYFIMLQLTIVPPLTRTTSHVLEPRMEVSATHSESESTVMVV
jgi:hypothetical protein